MTKTEKVLEKLHKEARFDFLKIKPAAMISGGRLRPEHFKKAYLPISEEQGRFVHDLIIQKDLKNIVEFGTSFGISTMYMADAVRQISGKMVTTELLQSKAERALSNLKEAELNDYVQILIGDAMQTLKGFNEPVDLLFLDGWKDLYLPLFQMLEPLFHSGTVIYSDNMDMSGTEQLAEYLWHHKANYQTEFVQGGKATLTIARAA
ncbi:MAG: class I SAM-dependent methyltransferase [Bacteroidota bacterium]